ncbi:MAG: hypothetical protein E4G92_03000 [Bacteroidia bacterium]|nr:MAG: hypothetical protein E4G92_03000 [Bacteroidia bacterium]
MKKFYTLLLSLILFSLTLSAQVVTERCFHLDKVQFLQQKQDYWRSHMLYSSTSRPMSMMSGGYYNLTEFNYGFGLVIKDTPFSNHLAGVTTVNGLRFGGGLALGVGVGYLQYNEGWLLPLYGDARYYMGKQRVKFFVMGAGGALFDVEHSTEIFRTFVNPGGGLTVPLAKNFHLSFTVGLMTQWVSFFDRRDSFINMKLGLLFGK